MAVTKHERTRAALIRGQVAQKLREVLQRHGGREDIVAGVSAATQILILDDDVRVVHGDAHENARALATELLPLLTSTLHSMEHVASPEEKSQKSRRADATDLCRVSCLYGERFQPN